MVVRMPWVVFWAVVLLVQWQGAPLRIIIARWACRQLGGRHCGVRGWCRVFWRQCCGREVAVVVVLGSRMAMRVVVAAKNVEVLKQAFGW